MLAASCVACATRLRITAAGGVRLHVRAASKFSWSDMFEKGLEKRKATLGAEYVEKNLAAADDLTRPFQEAMTTWCWGFGWGDAAIDVKTRSMMNLAMIGALGKMHEWELHCGGALTNGVSPEQIRAIVHVIGIYRGVPQAVECFRSARKVLEQAGNLPSARIGEQGKDLFEAGLAQRTATLGKEYVEEQLGAADDFTRPFQEAMTAWGWGFGWGDPVIDVKTRSMMNLAMIGALGKMHEWEVHCNGAITNGCTPEEIRAAIHVVGIYSGAPQALECFRVARKVLQARGKL